MEKNRADHSIKESGIALITALVITLVVLMLVGSLTYLLTRGLRAAIINKEYATVFDAANGGVEHAAGILSSYWNGETTSGLGITSDTPTTDSVLTCSSTSNILTVSARTADGKYRIDVSVKCLGKQAIPGAGGALAFPPPKGLSGGGIAAWYLFYSITTTSEETTNPVNKGRTEAIYRVPA